MTTAISDIDHRMMGKALEQARSALNAGQFPVGCVIALGEAVLAAGARAGSDGPFPNEVDHAEVVTLRTLFENHPEKDRTAMTIYSTMEPCLMCFGAILIAGVGRVVYGFEDAMGGAAGMDRTKMNPLYRESPVVIEPFVRRAESLALFREFFRRPENQYWQGSLLADHTLSQS